MGSRLSRQSSLDHEDFSKRRRELLDGSGETRDSRGGRAGGDFLFALMLKSDKLPGMLRRTNHSPYIRRVAWVKEIQKLLRDRRMEQATDVLKLLRKDLGLEGTSLNDILYKNAAFLNLVDPISHELLLSLAREMQCPKKDADTRKSSDKICRQLIYHLTPHSKWLRQSMTRRKSQACLKTTLQKKLSSESVDLSGVPLSTRDVRQVAFYLQNNRDTVVAVDISFTELQDENLKILLPLLASLPKLSTLALNGNRLTLTILKELTEMLKDPKMFSSLAWIDLGNNVDIFSLPQPFLVSLRKRCPKQGNLPTILEFGESQASEPPERPRGLGGEEEEETDDANRTESMGELRSEVEEELDGELEIEEMMEELLDFDREAQGKDEEDESMWTLGEQRKEGRRRRCCRGKEEEEEEEQTAAAGGRAVMADDDSSHLSCSSQSQRSSGATEPMRAEEADDSEEAATDRSGHLT